MSRRTFSAATRMRECRSGFPARRAYLPCLVLAKYVGLESPTYLKKPKLLRRDFTVRATQSSTKTFSTSKCGYVELTAMSIKSLTLEIWDIGGIHDAQRPAPFRRPCDFGACAVPRRRARRDDGSAFGVSVAQNGGFRGLFTRSLGRPCRPGSALPGHLQQWMALQLPAIS